MKCVFIFRLYLYRNAYPQYSIVYRMMNELLMAFVWYWIMFHYYFEEVMFHIILP